jgi:hypothetical protein
MKALILSSALLAAMSATPTPALALDFVLVGHTDDGGRFYVERNVTHTRDAAVAIGQSFTEGAISKHLLYVRAVECKRGYGSLHASDLQGKGMQKVGDYTLGSVAPVRSVADGVAEHMCAPFDY